MTPCDQPSSIHSGTRANALHIAAQAGKLRMVELILELVTDPSLLERMYPRESAENRAQRQEYLLDLYLNMPKKGDFDTPLHQAAKWGHWQVVEFLVLYSSCDTRRKNGEEKTPAEVACSRMGHPDADVKKKILDLLADRVYIPVYRAEDQSIPGFIGAPISPNCNEDSSSSPLKSNNLRLPMPAFNPLWSPLSPRTKSSPFRNNTYGDSPLIMVKNLDFNSFEKGDPLTSPISIKALMGPLSPNDAEKVKNEWKKNSPMRLADPEKGLEKQGRQLAQKFNTKLVEYWPFLDAYCDIKTQDGLQMLENHLQDQSRSNSVVCNNPDDSLSDIAANLAKMNLNSSMQDTTDETQSRDVNSNQELGVINLLKDKTLKQPWILDNVNFASSPLSHSAVWNQVRQGQDSSILSNDSHVSFIGDISRRRSASSSSSNESYVSALSSLDDDSIYSAEEGSWIYIEGDRPGKADVQVYEALAGCEVDAKRYPGVFTWKCLVESVSPLERKSWKTEKPNKFGKVPAISFDESMSA